MMTLSSDRYGQNRQWLVGPADGANRLLVSRSEWPAGFFVGLHRHDGEEAFYVLQGNVRFTVDGKQILCGPGDTATVPTGAEHGFTVLADAVILVIREQILQSIAVQIDEGGTRREIEIFQYGPPWSKDPPPEIGLTSAEDVRSIYLTTKHLL
jgi:quercetin dioxygenase-like cupin family protein